MLKASERDTAPSGGKDISMVGGIKPTRKMAALMGFVVKAEVDATFKQHPFELGDGHIDLVQSWRASSDAVRLLSPTPPNAEIGFFDGTLLNVVNEIKARPTFARHYEAVDDYQFALVPIDALLTPQWVADLDYIDELAGQIPENAPLEDQIRFAMAEGTITQPIISGPQVIFTSRRRDLYADQIPRVREVEPGEFEIVVRASSRPNYVSVASVGGRLLLTNGVHKVSAFSRKGYERVPCVLRQIGRFEESGLNLQTSLFRPELLSSQRPAQVIDFLNEAIAVPLRLRTMYQVLRVGIAVEMLNVPAIPRA